MARATGLEPATSGVTGRHSNRLSYARAFLSHRLAQASVYCDGGALVAVNGRAVKWCLDYPQPGHVAGRIIASGQSRVLIEKTS